MEEVGLRWRRGTKPSTLKPIDVTRKAAGEEEEEEELLSPASRLFHEPNFNVYVVAILGCKTKIDPDLVVSKLPHTLLKHPRFSSLQVVVNDGNENKEKHMKWVPTTVNLKNHVIVPDVDQSTFPTSAAGQKFVEDYISDLTKTTIDGSKQPLWDLHLLNVKTAPDSEAVGVFRIHHSLGDGTSLMSLLLACTRQISDPESLPTIPTRKPKKQEGEDFNDGGVWRRVTWRMVVRVWMMAVLMWNTAVDVLAFFLTAIGLKTDTVTPLMGPHGVEHLPRRFVWRTVSLDDFKFVKNAMDATINDVALGATQAGLSRYLNRKFGTHTPNIYKFTV